MFVADHNARHNRQQRIHAGGEAQAESGQKEKQQIGCQRGAGKFEAAVGIDSISRRGGRGCRLCRHRRALGLFYESCRWVVCRRLRLITAAAGNVKRSFHRRIAHAGIGAALVFQHQAIAGRRGLGVVPTHLGVVVVHGLAAEKFIVLFFAAAEFRRGKQALRLGFGNDFALIHIVAVGHFEIDLDAFVVSGYRRHEGFFGRQQVFGIDGGLRQIAQAQTGRKRENQFFHGGCSVFSGCQTAAAVGKMPRIISALLSGAAIVRMGEAHGVSFSGCLFRRRQPENLTPPCPVGFQAAWGA